MYIILFLYCILIWISVLHIKFNEGERLLTWAVRWRFIKFCSGSIIQKIWIWRIMRCLMPMLLSTHGSNSSCCCCGCYCYSGVYWSTCWPPSSIIRLSSMLVVEVRPASSVTFPFLSSWCGDFWRMPTDRKLESLSISFGELLPFSSCLALSLLWVVPFVYGLLLLTSSWWLRRGIMFILPIEISMPVIWLFGEAVPST